MKSISNSFVLFLPLFVVSLTVDELTTTGFRFASTIFSDWAVLSGSQGDFQDLAIYHLNKTSNTWHQTQHIFKDNIDTVHTSLWNNTLFCSGSTSDSFSTPYVFELDADTLLWNVSSTVSIPDDVSVSSASISNNYLLIGYSECSDKGVDAGCVLVYKKEIYENGTVSWPQIDTIYGSDTNAGHKFGSKVDIWNDKYVIVSAPENRDAANGTANGVAYIFEILLENDVIFEQKALLFRSPNDTSSFYFGGQVAIFDSYAAVVDFSSPFDVYFYQRDSISGNWNEVTRYVNDDSYEPLYLDLYNNYCMIGNRVSDSVYILHRRHSTGTWEHMSTISNLTQDAFIGNGVSIFGDYALIGTHPTGRWFVISDFKPDDISVAPTTLPTIEPSSFPSAAPSLHPTEVSFQPSDEPTHLDASLISTKSEINNNIDGEDGANAESENEGCSEKCLNSSSESKDVVIGVLATLACILFASNVGVILYFRKKVPLGAKKNFKPPIELEPVPSNVSGVGLDTNETSEIKNEKKTNRGRETSLDDQNDELYTVVPTSKEAMQYVAANTTTTIGDDKKNNGDDGNELEQENLPASTNANIDAGENSDEDNLDETRERVTSEGKHD